MNTFSGSSYGIWGGWHIHMLFGLALLVGLVFFVVWAIRAIGKKELASWALALIIIGALGVILTAGWGGKGWTMMHGNNSSWQEMAEHMEDEDHSDLQTSEDWQEHMKEEMSEHMGFDK